MKYKQILLLLGLVVAAVCYTGCSQTSESKVETAQDETISEEEESSENIMYGEVVSIDDSKITINVGTMQEMPQEEEAPREGETPQEGEAPQEGETPQNGERPSLLELTGEEQTISITEDTVLESQNMGPGGQGNGPAIEKPEDEANDNGGITEESGGTISLSDIQVGDTVIITIGADGSAEKLTVISMGGGKMNSTQPSGKVDHYEAATEFTEDTKTEGEIYASAGTDENAILVSENITVNLSDAEITRESADSTGGDNSSFYGVGAALLNTAGTTFIQDSVIKTDSAGGAGLFAYGSGIIYAADTTITTQQDTSGGIHAAGGGSLYAWDLYAETNGTSSAAIRSDRGGGTMVVDGGSYTSNGADSPAVYCTANIAVHDAKLTSTKAEAVCIEGLNSLYLYDCDLTGTMPDDERNDCVWNVILYQSMSGDSEVGNSTFEMNGGTLTASNGGMFYTTNTESTITLSGVDITYPEENDFFLKCTGNQNQRGWGQTGDNGADCIFTAVSQDMEGDVIWDSISDLDFYMTDGSVLTGAAVKDENCVTETGDGYCNLTIDETSQWVVTKDSTLTSLNLSGTAVDESGKTVTVQGVDGTVYVEGSSEYTVTVESFAKGGDTSQASQTTQWTEHQVEKPSDMA